ncbi:hypothetical protein ASA1KI_20820 [Opitutales bacterium ASA1]|uniref:hypothetical protein n=1 Tax=Congregicoccus parvus TaxID=3081749 RepID=UPI002B2F1020|nr:hypothetical protein ASA1KI_20820 [Opitutales bacterium ASA1]
MSRRALSVAEILPRGWEDVFSPAHPRIGVGYDIATTTKKKSNPSALAVVQQVGPSYFARLVLRWKTKDPDVARAILRKVITSLPHGLRARRLCVDATNERYFATDVRSEFAAIVPVELVVSSEGKTHRGEDMIMKTFLGNQLVETINDGYLPLPEADWLKRDIRQVVIDRGAFVAEVDEYGNHGDCFDAIKLALHALIAGGGPADARAAATGTLGKSRGERPGIKNPLTRRKGASHRLSA